MKREKSYPINNSPLYKLSSKTKLASILGVDRKYLIKFVYTRDNYRCWEIAKKNSSKKRPVEDPVYELKMLQSSLNRLLSRIITKEYLMSGKKHTSYVSNAKYHQNSSYVYCFDLSSFFQTAKREYIFKAFVNEFLMSRDIAWLLTDLVTIPKIDNSDGYIPTGSPSSQSVIYWAYKVTFDKILALSEKKKLKFSLYVDDMTFSSNHPIESTFPKLIAKICSKVDLTINQDKTEYSSKNQYKKITGCVITPDNRLRVPNKKRKELLDILAQKNLNTMTPWEIRSLYGKLNSLRQIEGNIFPKLYNQVKKMYALINMH